MAGEQQTPPPIRPDEPANDLYLTTPDVMASENVSQINKTKLYINAKREREQLAEDLSDSIGTESFAKKRIRLYQDAGILRVLGSTVEPATPDVCVQENPTAVHHPNVDSASKEDFHHSQTTQRLPPFETLLRGSLNAAHNPEPNFRGDYCDSVVPNELRSNMVFGFDSKLGNLPHRPKSTNVGRDEPSTSAGIQHSAETRQSHSSLYYSRSRSSLEKVRPQATSRDSQLMPPSLSRNTLTSASYPLRFQNEGRPRSNILTRGSSLTSRGSIMRNRETLRNKNAANDDDDPLDLQSIVPRLRKFFEEKE